MIGLLALSPVVQSCGESTPSDNTKTSSATGSASSTDRPSPPAPLTGLQRFWQGSFCKKYQCVNPDTWPLSDGATNYSFHLNLAPAVSLEVATKTNGIEEYGLTFYESDRLGNTQLTVIDDLIAAIPDNEATNATRRFVRANIERPVEQIQLAKSTHLGRYQLWAGRVGNQAVVSIQPVATGGAPAHGGVIPFKVAAQSGTAMVLLVDRTSTDEDLTRLVRAVQKARAEGTLPDLIPPTTPGGSRGPYAVINLFVMSDPQWATAARLNSFINPSSAGISTSEREFGKRVLAYYFFTSLGNEEEGSLGYASEDHKYTAKYVKLF